MANEYLETLGKYIRYKKEYVGNDTYRLYIKKNELEFLEKSLQRLEAIDKKRCGANVEKIIIDEFVPSNELDNAKPSEALNCIEKVNDYLKNVYDYKEIIEEVQRDINTIKQSLLKAQKQEKENEILKEIIKSLFDRGCPLHQYIDKNLGLTIEVDSECSIMHLGEFEGVDLNEKLQEVLEND